MAFLTTSLAEPPSHSYGAPAVSSGYSYEPHVSAGTDYVEQHVGHQPSEGLNLDPHLLHKIEQILIQHENSGSNRIISIPSISHSYGPPSHSYGPPSHSYGPPSHWSASSRVVGIDFGHLRQSIPVAQYVGKERYAPSYHQSSHAVSSGWNAGHSAAISSGWSSGASSEWIQPRAPVIIASAPAWSLAAPKPSSSYGLPRW